MLRKILQIVVALVSALTGLILMEYLLPQVAPLVGYDIHAKGMFGYAAARVVCGGIGALVAGWLGWVITPFMLKYILKYAEVVATLLAKVPSGDILVTLVGVIVGLVLANLAGAPFSHLPYVGPYIPIVLSIIFGITGAKVALRKNTDILHFFNRRLPLPGKKSADKEDPENEEPVKTPEKKSRNKLLDTSVIIDGRIVDILETGFLEGNLIIPHFVLDELQSLADSSDDLKRAKGRRGLDLIHELQLEENNILVEDVDYHDVIGVDSKLVRMAIETGSMIITNDFNLNKVASIQGIDVLNINDLANAVKPVVIPGEEMMAYLLREGKENGQAVAYLQDGTMIVVEGGKPYIGKRTRVTVTSVLQTSAGRMIFAKLSDAA